MLNRIKQVSPATMAVIVVLLAGCGGYAIAGTKGLDDIDKRSNNTQPFIPPWPSVEYNNYNRAQRLYASQTTIIWCTTTWGNANAPLVTTPIAGKLTSSSVSYFPSSRAKTSSGGDSHHVEEYTPERRSVDGMYHGSPPPYRYGFTPGGQYVDFSGMQVFCTTALTKFQREKTKLSVGVDPEANAATTQAEAALKSGNHAEAQRILADALDK